jgi:hypothetical protein
MLSAVPRRAKEEGETGVRDDKASTRYTGMEAEHRQASLVGRRWEESERWD